MSYISNLTLALSIFTDRQVHAASVSKVNPKYYHVYYKHEGKMRVMLVPREAVDSAQLQHEVGTLLSRSHDIQHEQGHLDAIPAV